MGDSSYSSSSSSYLLELERRNQALSTNRNVSPQANLAITTHGSDWYYAVCAIMGVSTLLIAAAAFRKPRTHRLFHYITAGITLVACIAYFTMGSNLGQTPIQAEFVRRSSSQVRAAGTREIFYVRYIDWFITTPLLLLDLALTAALPFSTIGLLILADWIMIVCGLVGALVSSSYKWGYYTFGMVAFFYIVYALVFEGRHSAYALGSPVGRTFTRCGLLTLFLWFLYPIAWGVSEGGNVIHPDSEAVFYGILDVLAKPGFGLLLLWGHRNIDPADLGLVSGPGAGPRGPKNRHSSGTEYGGDRAVTNGAGPANPTGPGTATGTTTGAQV